MVLGRSTNRLGTNAPSFPLVVARVVLYAWRPADSGPLLDSPAGWCYDAGDHGPLSPGGEPSPPATLMCRWASVSQLREAPRGRGERGLCPATGGPEAGAVLYTPRPGHARHCGDGVAGRRGSRRYGPPGAVPVGRLQGTSCEPPPLHQGALEEYASYVRFTCRKPPLEPTVQPPRRGQAPRHQSQLRRPGVGPPEGPAPHHVPRLCRARRCPLAGGRPALRRCVVVRPAVPRVRGAPLPKGGRLSRWCTPAYRTLPNFASMLKTKALRACGAHHGGGADGRQLAAVAGPQMGAGP